MLLLGHATPVPIHLGSDDDTRFSCPEVALISGSVRLPSRATGGTFSEKRYEALMDDEKNVFWVTLPPIEQPPIEQWMKDE
jgi:hypothetical protein